MCTRVVQEIHDSTIYVYPRREVLYTIVARQLFQPSILRDIRTFVDNCDRCSSNKAQKTLRHRFLKLLLIPDRIQSEISIDFITKLLISKGCTNIVVIIDRLGKGVVADGLESIDAESVTKQFLRHYYLHHFLLRAIVLDRGTQFTSAFQKQVCNTLGIRRRLSTTFSLKTDRSIERANEVVETVLRELVDQVQENQIEQLQVRVGVIYGQNAASTRVSPFFITHGQNQEVFDFELPLESPQDSPVLRVDKILHKLKEVRELVETMIVTAQEAQETAANQKRTQAPVYRVGNKVWLSLENIKTDRPSKKLDQRYGKFTVQEVYSSYTYRLDVSSRIHDVFPTRLLRPVQNNPLPRQVVREPQPPRIVVDREVEYRVEKILDQKKGRGGSEKYLVKWEGYKRPTQEPYDFVKDLIALDQQEQRKQAGYVPLGGRRARRGGMARRYRGEEEDNVRV